MLYAYRESLKSGQSTFQARPDNLRDILGAYRNMLGDVHKELAKVYERDGHPVSFSDVDNYYFHAMGVAYATYAMMQALEIEFADIVKTRNIHEMWKEFNFSMDQATNFNPPPFIFDGRRNAWIVVNHRSNLETDINDGRFKIISMMAAVKD